MRNNTGFTLVEILVVLVIISIVSVMVVISINHNPHKTAEALAKKIVTVLHLAEKESMLLPEILGVKVNDNSIEILKYIPAVANKKTVSWSSLNKKQYFNLLVPASLTLQLQSQDEKVFASHNPQIAIYPNNMLTPFVLFIADKKTQQILYKITGKEIGEIKLESYHEKS